jgi:hypothetical protein
MKTLLLAAVAAIGLSASANAGGLIENSEGFQSPHTWQVNWNRLMGKAHAFHAGWGCHGKVCGTKWPLKAGVNAILMHGPQEKSYCFDTGASTIDCYNDRGGKEVWTTSAEEEAPAPAARGGSVPMNCSDGACHLQVDLGDRNLADMVLDTGAMGVSVTRRWAEALLAEGAAQEAPPVMVTMANGATEKEDAIWIRRIRVGDRVATHVFASVSDSGDAMMLLGTNALHQMGRFSVDLATGVLVFG